MDTIANMLQSIINAQRVNKKRVAVPYSGFQERLANLLKEKGLIGDVRVQEGPLKKLIISLSYDNQDRPNIRGLKRTSTPGRHVYVKKGNIPYSFDGFGSYIISTSQGLMDDSQARTKGLGGEIVCEIW